MNMLKIESSTSFKQDKNYVLTYLQYRKVNVPQYFELINNNDFGILKNNTIVINGLEYRVDALCTCSSNSGYDIVNVNKNLQTDNGDTIVIAGVAGDDVICMDISTGEIFIWLIETGEWEKEYVAPSIDVFINMINYKK